MRQDHRVGEKLFIDVIDAVTGLLNRAGFTVRNVPGQTIQFSRGALTVNPAEVIEGSFAEAGNRDVWVATWTEAGIADRVFPSARS